MHRIPTSKHFFHVKQTIAEMLHDRGYIMEYAPLGVMEHLFPITKEETRKEYIRRINEINQRRIHLNTVIDHRHPNSKERKDAKLAFFELFSNKDTEDEYRFYYYIPYFTYRKAHIDIHEEHIDNNDRIQVTIIDQKLSEINTANMRAMLALNDSPRRQIVVSTGSGAQRMKDLFADLSYYRTELWVWEELMINKTFHIFTHQHTLLTEDQIRIELPRLDASLQPGETESDALRRKDLPELDEYDPIVKYIGAKRGDIVRITRKGQNFPIMHSATLGKESLTSIVIEYRYIMPTAYISQKTSTTKKNPKE